MRAFGAPVNSWGARRRSPSTNSPRRVVVSIGANAPPTEDDPGAVIEGGYTLTEDGLLRVYDTDRNLLGTEHPGADAGTAARRVLRAKKAASSFYDPINYSNSVY